MMAKSEYLPDEKTETPPAGQGSGSNGDNPFKLREGQFQATLAATKAVLTDPAFRRHQGAKTLFTFYLEFSFEPNVGGIRAGSICAPLDLVVSLIHAKRHSVIKWKRMLVRRGYIWEEKIPSPTNSGWPWTVVHVSCLVPKTDQRDLFPSAVFGTWRHALYGTLRSASLGTWVSASLGTSRSAVSGTLSEGRVQEGRGGPDTPRSEQGPQDPELKNFGAWKAKLSRLYPRELEAMIKRNTDELSALTRNPANFKNDLKPDVGQWVKMAREEIERLKATGKKRDLLTATDRESRIVAALKDSANYRRGALQPGPAAPKANITRKIDALKEALR